MFQIKNVSYAVPDKILLKNISINFKQNQIYGLIGHNGSGKSTLLKLLTRQIQPTSGEITLNNRLLNKFSSREYAKEVAYLPQYLPTATALTAKELVEMGRYAWTGLIGKTTVQDKQAIDEAFELTHTHKFKDQLVDTLSGGERSRIWLSMCLAQKSHYLLLDEPLAALDISHQIEVMSLIKNLSHQLNLGIIIVIHDINLAAQYCDQLIALKNGELLIQGEPKQIMTQKQLFNIYNVNMNIISHPKTGSPLALP